MARPLRVQLAGGFYHITSRGNRRQTIYSCDGERRLFLALLWAVAADHGWRVHAYCLMGNHYHLLVETTQPTLSAGMQRLQSLYAQRFNRRHQLTGHLFEGRFHATLIEGNVQLVAVARYIVCNPVRAGICATAGEWPWSSYRATTAETNPQQLHRQLLLAQFSPDPTRARARFSQYINDNHQPTKHTPPTTARAP
jgi:REP element-mobilizing transposase RayT